MSLGAFCSRDLVTIDAAESLTQAARLMRQHHVGFLVVVEAIASSADLRVTGVLTDRDIVTTVVAKEADPRAFKVGDVMTRSPLMASESSTLEVVLSNMREAGVRRVPVLGERNQLMGVLSLDDVLSVLAQQLTAVSGAVRGQRRSEQLQRP